jgi:phage gpG-like protein
MSQTNAIILRISRDRAAEFEKLFEAEQYPNWKKHHASGGLLSASLTRVEYGSEEDDAKTGAYVNYIVYAKLTGMDAHTAHDDDPEFKAYDEKAEDFQPEGPSVYGGTTIFEIGFPGSTT